MIKQNICYYSIPLPIICIVIMRIVTKSTMNDDIMKQNNFTASILILSTINKQNSFDISIL